MLLICAYTCTCTQEDINLKFDCLWSVPVTYIVSMFMCLCIVMNLSDFILLPI